MRNSVVTADKFGPVAVPPSYAKARASILTRADGTKISYAQIAKGTGIDVTHVCRIFTRRRGLSLNNAIKIAPYLGISVEKLKMVLDTGKEEGGK